METNLTKALSIFGVVCFSMASLFADSSSNNMNNDSSSNNMNMQCAVPPAAYPGEDAPYCYITADYTYWVARQAGLAYVTSNDYSGIGGSTSPAQGSVFYPSITGRSGFKVGAGCFLHHDGWDLYAEYTWFWNKQNINSYGANAGFTVNQGASTWWVNDANTGFATDVYQSNSFWANWFNRVDAMIARSFYAGHYLQLRPFLGLLGAWDEQWYNIRYNQSGSTTRWVTWANNQKWWGIGPYAGLCSAFMFPIGDQSTQWSLFMDTGMSLPWQKWQVNKKVTDNASTLPTDAWTQDNCWSTEPMVEMALGLRWETWWNEGMNWNFMLQAAWESQVYFSHNHMSPVGYEAVSGQGDYIMQGLTIKAKVGF